MAPAPATWSSTSPPAAERRDGADTLVGAPARAASTGSSRDPALGPRPCTGRLVTVPVGAARPRALESDFETDSLPLRPGYPVPRPVTGQSAAPSGARCATSASCAGLHHYHEQVSTDCARAASLDHHRRARLHFHRVPGARRDHRSTSSARGRSPDVEVDEGSLVVQEIGARGAPAGVTTTKRVRFRPPFTGEQLALIMCALGYASIVEDLVLHLRDKDEHRGRPCRPRSGDSAPSPARGAPLSGSSPRGGRVEGIHRRVGPEAVASWEKIDAVYTADDLVQDASEPLGADAARGAAAVDAAARSARRGPRARPRDPEGS